jgi:hypothetical protein
VEASQSLEILAHPLVLVKRSNLLTHRADGKHEVGLRCKGDESTTSVRTFSIGQHAAEAPGMRAKSARTHCIFCVLRGQPQQREMQMCVCHEIFSHGSAYPEPLIDPIVTIYPRSGQNLRGRLFKKPSRSEKDSATVAPIKIASLGHKND